MRKKRVFVAILVLVIAILICAAIMKCFEKGNNYGEVVLSTNSGTNYKWDCKIKDNSIAKISKTYNEEIDKYIDGGEVLIHYIIKGKKEGTTVLTCYYIETTGEYIIDSNTYNITVDNKLNVEVVNSY